LRATLGPAGGALLAASAFMPDAATIARDQSLIRTMLLAPELPPLLAALGVKHSAAYAATAAGDVLPRPLAWMRGQTSGQYWSIIPLPSALAAQLPASGPHWQRVDPAARYSALIAHFRVLASFGLVAAVLSTSLILLAVYRRAAALTIMLPTTLGLSIALALPPLLGLPFSFFSVMGAFVVIGAGVDYAIFQWEHPGARGNWTRVGILLAAGMTCISIGLLALSSVFPVRSFGVTVALGIALSLILSPLVHSPHD
jgi:predicted exporter